MWPAQVRADQVVAAVFGGLLALVLTRWPVAGVVGAAGAGMRPPCGACGADDTAQRAEAVALWAEILRDGLGTSMEIETVLRTTAPIAPQLIRADVEAATARLAYMPYDDVLDELADKLDASSGDMVVSCAAPRGPAPAAARSVTCSTRWPRPPTATPTRCAASRWPANGPQLGPTGGRHRGWDRGDLRGRAPPMAGALRSPAARSPWRSSRLWCWAAMWWMSRMSRVHAGPVQRPTRGPP